MKTEAKRKLTAALLMVMMLTGGIIRMPMVAHAASGDTTVYITKTGECYHANGCASLKKSKIETTLKKAVDSGLRPCSKCHPVTLDADTGAAVTKAAAAAPAAAPASGSDPTVYLTKSGKCYHADGCASLKKSKIETTLSKAVAKGYTACSKCHPATQAAQTTAAKETGVSKEVEALKTYKGNNNEFNAYTYYMNNADLQAAIGPNGDALLKHYTENGKAEGRKAK